jgi:hypothetical protein
VRLLLARVVLLRERQCIQQPGVVAMYDLKMISCPGCRINRSVGKQCRTLAAVIVGAYDAMQEVRCVYRMYIPDLFWKLPNTSQITRAREYRALRSGHGLMKDYGEAGLYRVREKIHIPRCGQAE